MKMRDWFLSSTSDVAILNQMSPMTFDRYRKIMDTIAKAIGKSS